jgi:hypothetical protein
MKRAFCRILLYNAFGVVSGVADQDSKTQSTGRGETGVNRVAAGVRVTQQAGIDGRHVDGLDSRDNDETRSRIAGARVPVHLLRESQGLVVGRGI